MRGLFRLTLAAFVLTLVGGALAVLVGQTPQVSYAVVLASEADTTALLPAAKRWGLRVAVRQGPVFRLVGRPLLLDSLKALRPRPAYAEYDETTPLPRDSAATGDLSAVSEAGTWGLRATRMDSAWNRGLTGSGVLVGVLDSGIEPGHAQFEGRVRGYNVTTADTLAFTETPGCNGHGTHVTGTVAARDYGVAPAARVISVRVFEVIDGTCRAWSSVQVAGLLALQARGAQAINASIGGNTYIAGMANAVAAYRAQGGVFVGAAGNAGGTPPQYPSNYPAAVSVASVGQSGTKSGFSNYGAKLDVAAPGEGVVSTMPGGTTGSKSGTSMAAPHVAGFVALIRQRLPSISADSVVALLRAATTDLGAPGCDEQTGCGRIDGMRLVQLLIPPAPLVPSRATARVGETRCVTASGAAGPWTASTSADGLQVWTTDRNELCWRGDAPGTFTIRTRSN